MASSEDLDKLYNAPSLARAAHSGIAAQNIASHPVGIDLPDLLPILTRSLYSNPLVFLRENLQNAIDAIRIQQLREARAAHLSEHRIEMEVSSTSVKISDTGIGMSKNDMEIFFWKIGKSGKRTAEAQAAGVIGRFGIGGMSNFGACEWIEITSKTATASAIGCYARKRDISATENCIYYRPAARTSRGTSLEASMSNKVSLSQVETYITRLVEHLDIPVIFNGRKVSERAYPQPISSHTIELELHGPKFFGSARVGQSSEKIAGGKISLTIEITASPLYETSTISGYVQSSRGTILAYNRGFLLSEIYVPSSFGFGGSLEFPSLECTAGREALTERSHASVGQLIAEIDQAVAKHVASDSILASQVPALWRHINTTGELHLAGKMTVRCFGRNQMPSLDDVAAAAKNRAVYYCGDNFDRGLAQAYIDSGKLVLLLSTDAERRRVELRFLAQCDVRALDEQVTCTRLRGRAEDNVRFHEVLAELESVLTTQFCVSNVRILSGDLTHGALFLIPRRLDASLTRSVIVDPTHSRVTAICRYQERNEFSLAVYFLVQESIFPQLQHECPELQGRDFDAILTELRSVWERFRINPEDVQLLSRLKALTRVESNVLRAAVSNEDGGPTVVAKIDVENLSRVVSGILKDASSWRAAEFDQMEGTRTRKLTIRDRRGVLEALLSADLEFKVLDASGLEAVGLANIYVAMTDEAAAIYRRILERKPRMYLTWAAYRVGFLFFGTGQIAVYYDFETASPVIPSIDGLSQSVGSQMFEQDILFTKSKVYLPIPRGFEDTFLPGAAPLHLHVFHKIIRPRDTMPL